MPTILRINGYRFSFYAADRKEPPHVHVEKGDATAKIWLESILRVSNSEGFSSSQMRFILKTIDENKTYILHRWKEFFSV